MLAVLLLLLLQCCCNLCGAQHTVCVGVRVHMRVGVFTQHRQPRYFIQLNIVHLLCQEPLLQGSSSPSSSPRSHQLRVTPHHSTRACRRHRCFRGPCLCLRHRQRHARTPHNITHRIAHTYTSHTLTHAHVWLQAQWRSPTTATAGHTPAARAHVLHRRHATGVAGRGARGDRCVSGGDGGAAV